ncbi:hypothetical protein K469DRAFT_350607 [Zopfia rhizophila CBS 207.26]|uniref:Uncharacterized protein n=1 Tax=Zopfia rhizophila CBS 207.26 TaxID=1314779 RepID=A0A6A6DEN6_9PEZI|nr:hypothetical protein K469DRAFT_350607 [Zopfia rhizophila CBS 207.26]
MSFISASTLASTFTTAVLMSCRGPAHWFLVMPIDHPVDKKIQPIYLADTRRIQNSGRAPLKQVCHDFIDFMAP